MRLAPEQPPPPAVKYQARQTSLDRLVALKIIKPDAADDPDFAERFTREARTMAQLDHPNIVRVYDVGHREDPLTAVSARARSAPTETTLFLIRCTSCRKLRCR